MRTRSDIKEVQDLKVGEWVSWNHQKWYKVLDIEVIGGWAYIRMENHPTKKCSILGDIEMPWSTKPPN